MTTTDEASMLTADQHARAQALELARRTIAGSNGPIGVAGADADDARELADWILHGADEDVIHAEILDEEPTVDVEFDGGAWIYTATVVRPDGYAVTATITQPETEHQPESIELSEVAQMAAARGAGVLDTTLTHRAQREQPV